MPHPALRAEALSKRYRIGASAARPRTLKEAFVRSALAPLRNLERLRRLSAFDSDDEPDVVWALRDVSFELAHGEVLGIIGKNGAGKSTLLKILSRITLPTTGRARVLGRVGSLLEVGTGFHPELTGRDNVYLNGSILGITRADITRRFDEIVDFAGVGRFIDTPVKHYSSGM
jgi:homopolymeric O-antigen transport system ATP-binding protein